MLLDFLFLQFYYSYKIPQIKGSVVSIGQLVTIMHEKKQHCTVGIIALWKCCTLR